MRKGVLLIFFLVAGRHLFSQAVASFSCPDELCISSRTAIVNRSKSNKTNTWTVCTPSIFNNPRVDKLGIFDTLSASHTKMTMAFDSNYYLFLTNQYDSTITRIRFHRSWHDSLPELTVFSPAQLGRTIFNPQGIQVRYDPATQKWFGFVVCVDTRINKYLKGNLVRLDFGKSLDSVPQTAVVDSEQYHLMLPKGMQLERDASGKWHLFVANATNILPLSGPEGKGFSMAHYYFNDTINGLPIYYKHYANDMGITSALKEPQQVKVLQNPAGEWHGLILNSDATITRFMFGYSLEYWPYSEKLPALPALHSPVDFSLAYHYNAAYGFFINGYASKGMSLVGFDSTLRNPSALLHEPDAAYHYPVCISEAYQRADSLSFFVANSDKSILRVTYAGFCDSIVDTSFAIAPDTFAFPDTGFYYIRLTINKDSVDEQSCYRKIKVTGCPVVEGLNQPAGIIDVYPLPAADVLKIVMNGCTGGQVSLYNSSGIAVMKEVIAGRDQLQLDVMDLPPGLYIVVIAADGFAAARKIIKQ